MARSNPCLPGPPGRPTLGPGRFVNLQVDASLCAREPLCRECVSSCPVDIFTRPPGRSTAKVVSQNEDECILCQLCVDRCPVDAVSLIKLY